MRNSYKLVAAALIAGVFTVVHFGGRDKDTAFLVVKDLACYGMVAGGFLAIAEAVRERM